jgi:predicted CopG family antitoxin
MAVKTLTITVDAYAQLARLKRPGESFSQLIQRITMREPLRDLSGLLDSAPGDRLDRSLAARRNEFDGSDRRTAKRLRG